MTATNTDKNATRLAAAEAAMANHNFPNSQKLDILNVSRWEVEGRNWSRIIHGTRAGIETRIYFEVQFIPNSANVKHTSCLTLGECLVRELDIQKTDLCHNCRHLEPSAGENSGPKIRGICSKGNPATPWPCEFNSKGHIIQCDQKHI